ncbi:histidine kinase [Nitrospirillum viridazoti Y2]|uniref:FAD/FMN-containing dehydrogenase n=1 Tax=Nitrospirillum amazonense TaxID=28077 RepID=A0A560HQI8_9PROT|nr:FAD-binding protein [Nitrospirillum amazonense]EGX99604.1 histidine kinase [Nitrospirillum amazonense Y2]TWB48832.1 FAD/FMN-containing dehydrogenase [Nitrospirillum amazonense]
MGAFETATARRSFLKGLGALAAGASLPAKAQQLLADPGIELHPLPHVISKGAWSDLARGMKGDLVLPNDAYFGNYSQVNNLSYSQRPAVIARCETDADVSACLKWAQNTNTPFAVRSGGHNYAGFSTTSGLLIDMSPMAKIKADGDRVIIGGGAINVAVYRALERMGRTITHGRCEGVGAAGFLLGGGVGFNMRLHGIGSDLLRSTDLILANGEKVKANATDNSKLLWACRGGGGGNFGVNTSFTVQTYPVSTVTVFILNWSKNQERVLYELLHRLQEAPPGFGCKISATAPTPEQRAQGGDIVISVMGQAHQGTPPLKELFGNLLEQADEPHKIEKDLPYWEAQDFLSEEAFPYFYREQSVFLKTENLTEKAVADMIATARAMPGTSLPSAFKFFQVGGEVNRLAPTDTAFVHRGFDWLFSSEVNWWELRDPPSLVSDNLVWQQQFYDKVRRLTPTGGAYQNFPDPALKDWQSAYYAQNYKDLQKVKAEVDPQFLFRFAQAIKPA